MQFADRRTHPDDREVVEARHRFATKTAWEKSPRLVPQVLERYVTGTPVGRVTETQLDIAARRLALREAFDNNVPPVPPEAQAEDEVGRFQPYLAAFLLLLSQQITTVAAQSPGEYAARRARKASPQRSLNVTVVDVRKHRSDAEHAAGGGSGRTLEQRHLVGGYWRWQPYGPQRRLRKRIYVADYIRGPEDAPLVVKPRVQRV